MGERRIGSLLTAAAILLVCCAGHSSLLGDEPTPEPTADEGLQIDPRFTYGIGGAERPASFIAGDTIFMMIRTSALAIGSDERVDFSLQPELLDADGHPLTMLNPQRINYLLPYGGDEVTVPWVYSIPNLMVPGEYRIRMSVRDKANEGSATREVPFEILPEATFGAMGLRLAHDAGGTIHAGASFSAGSTVFLVCHVTGHDCSSGRMDLKARFTVHDLEGRALTRDPAVIPMGLDVPKTPEGVGTQPVPMHLVIPVHRTGRFVFRLELEDVQGSKKATYDVPIVVTETLEAAPPIAKPQTPEPVSAPVPTE